MLSARGGNAGSAELGLLTVLKSRLHSLFAYRRHDMATESRRADLDEDNNERPAKRARVDEGLEDSGEYTRTQSGGTTSDCAAW